MTLKTKFLAIHIRFFPYMYYFLEIKALAAVQSIQKTEVLVVTFFALSSAFTLIS